MAKKRTKVPVGTDAGAIHAAVLSERSDDTIILIVPSHGGDHPQKRLPDQDQWADAALKLFGRLYRGATAFTALQGIWVDDDGNATVDNPILIQSLVKREHATDEKRLELLAEFAQRMCREMKQDCVAVICNDTIHYVKSK